MAVDFSLRDAFNAILASRIGTSGLFSVFDGWKRTDAEIAANVVPVAYNFDPGDLRRNGFSAAATAAVNDQAMIDALASNQKVFLNIGGSFAISAPITFLTDGQALELNPAVSLNYSGTSQAVKFSGVNQCELRGYPAINTSNASGNGILFEPTASLDCRYNRAYVSTVSGKGGPSTASWAASGTYGVKFSRLNGTHACYFNHVYGGRLSGYNTNAHYDAPGGSSQNGPSGCAVHNITHDDYWFANRIESAEAIIAGGFANSSAGDAGHDTYYVHCSNGAFDLNAYGLDGEPGAHARPYNFDSGCNNNTLFGNFSNFGLVGIDNGSANCIETGRASYRPKYVHKRIAPAYGAVVTIDTSLATSFDIVATNGTNFTVDNPGTSEDGHRITVTLINSSGGALGGGTAFNSEYHLAGAIALPANGFNRAYDFERNGSHWYEKGRSAADVAN